MKQALAVLALVALAACSNQQMYHAVQDAQRVECHAYPDTRYEECMARLGLAYDEYRASRESLQKEADSDGPSAPADGR